MNVYVFPGQAAQFVGMGKDFYQEHPAAQTWMEEANALLGFRLTDVMFDGTEEDLKQTRITQPAVFLHATVKARLAGDAFQPGAVAGHSLGEFSALVAAGALAFEDGLRLVYQRALAMQAACEAEPGTMAAILGLDDEVVERLCQESGELVVPANYNCPGQLVVSGTLSGVARVMELAEAAGAVRVIELPVGGAFHSPLMAPAQVQLAEAIANTPFSAPRCPVYQNVDAQPYRDPAAIQVNLINQLTAPVRWTQTMLNMIADGATAMIEVGGTGKVLQGLVKKIDRKFPTSNL